MVRRRRIRPTTWPTQLSPAGFEPATSGSGGRRAIQLRHGDALSSADHPAGRAIEQANPRCAWRQFRRIALRLTCKHVRENRPPRTPETATIGCQGQTCWPLRVQPTVRKTRVSFADPWHPMRCAPGTHAVADLVIACCNRDARPPKRRGQLGSPADGALPARRDYGVDDYRPARGHATKQSPTGVTRWARWSFRFALGAG